VLRESQSKMVLAQKVNIKIASNSNTALLVREINARIENVLAHVHTAIIANRISVRFSFVKSLSADVLKYEKKKLKDIKLTILNKI
jgi:hypothetical protein